MALFRGRRSFPRIAGRTVVLIDDGSSTIPMLSAALSTLRSGGAHRVVLASALIHPDAEAALRSRCDEIVGTIDPRNLEFAFRDFETVGDDDVIVQLNRAHGALSRLHVTQ
jgi:putative phosphoribosyl transferase